MAFSLGNFTESQLWVSGGDSKPFLDEKDVEINGEEKLDV
jgi:ribosome-associated protein YbcJ (S4-like RNA binding protein)